MPDNNSLSGWNAATRDAGEIPRGRSLALAVLEPGAADSLGTRLKRRHRAALRAPEQPVRPASRPLWDRLRKGRRMLVRDWFRGCVAKETGLKVREINALRCGDIRDEGRRHAVVLAADGGTPRVIRVGRRFIEQAREYLAWKQASGEAIETESPLFGTGERGRGHTRTAPRPEADAGFGLAEKEADQP